MFFFGTLRHIPLLRAVLGHDAQDVRLSDATLADHVVSSAAEGPYPTIAFKTGATAHGLLAQGLSRDDLARLHFFEDSFGYQPHPLMLTDGRPVLVYLPQPGAGTPDGPWSLEDWAKDWAALSCHAAREVMGYFGDRTATEVAAMFPRIRARALQKVNGAKSLHGAGTLQGQIDIRKAKRSYAHHYAVDDVWLRHARFDGTMSAEIERAVFIGSDAAILLPYDPQRDRVLLVEQMRMGPLARGDRAVWQLEPIAGGIDPGETPQKAARREAVEEAGLRLGEMEKIAEVYASPGNATEFFYVFVGCADLPDSAAQSGGLEAEDEDIRSHLLSFDELMALVTGFGATNAPLVMAAFWLAQNRDRLRLAWAKDTPEPGTSGTL